MVACGLGDGVDPDNGQGARLERVVSAGAAGLSAKAAALRTVSSQSLSISASACAGAWSPVAEVSRRLAWRSGSCLGIPSRMGNPMRGPCRAP
jgi:hypothetical protein